MIKLPRNVLLEKIANYCYLAFSIIGASLIAFNMGYQLIGYSCFLVSGISSLYLILVSNVSRSLLTMAIIFIIIDIVGIVRA